MLRQLEQAVRAPALRALVAETLTCVERDLIRRV
jgi:hypothetical protein